MICSVSGQTVSIQANDTTGCGSLSINLSFTTTGMTPPYSTVWTIAGTNYNNVYQPSVNFTTPGLYTVSLIVTDAKSLKDTAQNLIIKVGKKPQLTLTSQNISFGNHGFRLSGLISDTVGAPTPYQNIWTLPGGENPVTREIVYEFGKTGTFPVSLIVKDEAGCADTAAVSVFVKDTLSIPNVFTPNDDGQNDFFTIYSDGESIISLKVFTRSGTLIYQAEATVMQWDGRMTNGQKADSGLYYYIVESKGKTNAKKSGYLYLFR
jgi:gliding motility-associated-like protein